MLIFKNNNNDESFKNLNLNLEKLREKFFNFLLKKPCTSGQASEYLSRQDAPEDFCNLLLDEAINLKLIDNLAYAKLFIEGHLTWGNAKIIHELLNRGLSRDEINEALDDSEDEISRAREISESWLKLGYDKRKIINRLLSRGFSHKSARVSCIDINNEKE